MHFVQVNKSMTGFIRGLFSKKPQPAGEEKIEAKPKQRPPKQEKVSLAYFLDDSESSSMGDSAYMKAVRKVRRTFPKTAGQLEDLELVQEISALSRVVGGKLSDALSSTSESERSSETSQSGSNSTANPTTTPRRRPDRSMDTFRKMARDIKK